MNHTRLTYGQSISDNECSKRDIPSFIEPAPPLISNPFMRPKPVKGTNLLDLFDEDSEYEEPDLVQVYLRMKPCSVVSNLYEIKANHCLVTSTDTATVGHGRRTQHNVSKMYSFTRIFGPEINQKEIFESVVKDNLKKLTEGHSYTLLTYGASGSGKTYTLMGTVAEPGLVPRSLEYLFKIVDAAQLPIYRPNENGAEKLSHMDQKLEFQWVRKLRQVSAPVRDKYRRMSAQLNNDFTISSSDLSNRTGYYVWVSFIEIYNEAIYDLLVTPDRRALSKLKIREDSNGHVYIKGATQAFVRSGEEAYDVMVAGKHNLQVAATGVHQHSSRSHCIFTITLLTEAESGGVRSSCVRLCDLAGCERAARTRNTGARMQESRAINSSLHVLERCLHTLRRKQRARPDSNLVPYRESKLTRVLGAGLSGSRKETVSMVVTVNPDPRDMHETKHVLQLAAVAKDIQINGTIAETSMDSCIPETTIACSEEVTKLRADNERLQFELAQAHAQYQKLLQASEENQASMNNTMRQYVEEAKDITKQYYESQIRTLKARHQEELNDLKEEYERRLHTESLRASLSPNRRGQSGTMDTSASPKSQHTITEMALEIALLQENLAAERLARERLEEEIQHLRKCIEDREDSDKFPGDMVVGKQEDIILDEAESGDEVNESLEPSFRIESDTNMTQNISSSDEGDSSENNDVTKDNDDTKVNTSNEGESSRMSEGESTLDNTSKTVSVLEQSSKETNSDSFKTAKSTADSAAEVTNISDMSKSENYIHKSNNSIDFRRGTYVVLDESNIDKAPEDSLISDEKINISFEGKNIGKVSKVLLDKFKKSGSLDGNQSLAMFEQYEKDIQSKIEKETKDWKSNELQTKLKRDKCNFFYDSVDDKQDNELELKENEITEPVEMVVGAKSVTETSDSQLIVSNSNAQGKTSNLNAEQIASVLSPEKEAESTSASMPVKSYFKFSDVDPNSTQPTVTTPEGKTDCHEPVTVVKSKTYFDSPTAESNKQDDKELIINASNNLGMKEDYYKSDDVQISTSPKNKEISTILEKIKELNKTRTFFDNLGYNEPCVKKNIETTETLVRSPSIVKDDMPQDYDPTNIKKLLGESTIINESAVKNKNTQQLKKDSIDVFDEISSPVSVKHVNIDTVEEVAQSVGRMSIDNENEIDKNREITDASDKLHLKTERKNITCDESITEDKPKEVSNLSDFFGSASENASKEYENLYKDVSEPVSLDFCDLLDTNKTETKDNETEKPKYNLRKTQKHNESSSENQINIVGDGAKTDTKYNLRHKLQTDEDSMDNDFQPKTLSKRNLRLRRRKNQNPSDIDSEGDNAKLKDIANLQKEFSDVTMDIPAYKKVVKDIPSPEKNENENVMPPLEAMSCPNKSVTRSRRKLFTPRAEPLEESLDPTGDSNERIRVPRPSYHRARARRKL